VRGEGVDEVTMRSCVQHEVVSRCDVCQVSVNDIGRYAMRWWQARQDGIGLHRRVRDQTNAPVEGTCGGLVRFVPGCESGNKNTGVGRDHRRTRSSVSRTISSVNGGSAQSGRATRTEPSRTSSTSVGAGSISIRPSRSVISTCSFPRKPRRSRIRLGITKRPAGSMVVLMA